MSNYYGKKIFSDELYTFLNIPKTPYYLNYIYNAFFEKIKNEKHWNSYKLSDNVKKMLHIEYGSYIRSYEIKRMIKMHHVLSTQLPSDIISLKSNTIGNFVQEICI